MFSRGQALAAPVMQGRVAMGVFPARWRCAGILRRAGFEPPGPGKLQRGRLVSGWLVDRGSRGSGGEATGIGRSRDWSISGVVALGSGRSRGLVAGQRSRSFCVASRAMSLTGFEPVTSPLSGVRSNQLSYRLACSGEGTRDDGPRQPPGSRNSWEWMGDGSVHFGIGPMGKGFLCAGSRCDR